MNKLKIIILLICVTLGTTFFLVSCGGDASCAHTYGEWKVVTAATCTVDGLKERVCTKCNNKITDSIPAIGHNFVNGVCTDCGAKA